MITKTNPNEVRYEIDYNRKVFVYKNLHKDCWSIRQDGLVKGHCHDLNLTDCEFRVNEKSRQKVLSKRQKNVHAGVSGYISKKDNQSNMVEISYNPYKFGNFFEKQSEKPIFKCKSVQFYERKVTAQIEG